MGGALAGTFAHESLHALAAAALGELDGVGWQGGLAGGPYVDYRAPTRLRSEVVRKAPIVAGVLAAIGVAASVAPTPSWVASAGFAVGLLWASPEDLFVERARASATQ